MVAKRGRTNVLEALSLHHATFSLPRVGHIPEAMGALSKLGALSLGDNKLNGERRALAM